MILGIVLLGESASVTRMISVALIIAGIIGLSFQMPERLLLRTRLHSKRLLLKCRDAHFTNEEKGYEKNVQRSCRPSQISQHGPRSALSALHLVLHLCSLRPA